MVIYAISDLEGFHPSELISDTITLKDEVIICGDVLDSTMLSKDHLTNKSKNLRTIFDIVTKPNFKLTFGNRDLNKIKVLPLSILKTKDNSSNDLVNNFNNGLLDLNLKTYNDLYTFESNLEWVHKMSNWYPFWGGINDNNIEYWKNDIEPVQYKFFERRFHKIFGADTSIGTMSAGNLLETIPRELKLYDQNNNDFNAFLVLAVFRAMLLKVNSKNKDLEYFFEGRNISLKQSMFSGLLYRMYLDQKNNMIIKKCDCDTLKKCNCISGKCECPDDKNMYLFSHGGVSNNIISDNTLDKIDQELKNENNESLKSKLTNARNIFNKIGGYYKTESKSKLESKNIENKINSFNEKIKNTIKAIFDEDHTKQLVPSDNMLLLLIASASFDCNSYIKKINGDQSICSKLDILNTSSDLTSTMAGIKRLRQQKSMFYKQGNLYNIFGHNPNGFFSTIDLFENGNSKTYLINLDTSNTFLSTKANAKTDKISSYLRINGKDVFIHSNVNIKAGKDEILINENPIKSLEDLGDSSNTKIISFTDEATKNSFIPGELSNILINRLVNENLDEHIRRIGENEKIFYHGFTLKKGQKYILLTYHRIFGPPFPRCLVILSQTDFDKIFPILATKKGGKWLNKYLKYKQKYISLKNQLEL
jgi:hypothetical protein